MDRRQMAHQVEDAISPWRHFRQQFLIVHRRKHLVELRDNELPCTGVRCPCKALGSSHCPAFVFFDSRVCCRAFVAQRRQVPRDARPDASLRAATIATSPSTRLHETVSVCSTRYKYYRLPRLVSRCF